MKETITALTERAVPVCAHLGLTPQFVNKFGGYKVQGRDEKAAEMMIEHACELEESRTKLLLGPVPKGLNRRVELAKRMRLWGGGDIMTLLVRVEE